MPPLTRFESPHSTEWGSHGSTVVKGMRTENAKSQWIGSTHGPSSKWRDNLRGVIMRGLRLEQVASGVPDSDREECVHDVHPNVKRSCHLSDCPDHIITLFPRFPMLIHLSLHLCSKPATAGGAEKTPVAKQGTKRSVGSSVTPAPAAKRARKGRGSTRAAGRSDGPQTESLHTKSRQRNASKKVNCLVVLIIRSKYRTPKLNQFRSYALFGRIVKIVKRPISRHDMSMGGLQSYVEAKSSCIKKSESDRTGHRWHCKAMHDIAALSADHLLKFFAN
ncbi:hypothetical protein C8R45DRAFT_1136013 [Mycena sanguinolenta]|nr:hypothetical protein C8R45DRAFT_1136013 [Mycena sanguinolenta]